MSRLVEYFVVVGAGDALEPITPKPNAPPVEPAPTSMLEFVYKPSVMDRFPLQDYKETSFPGGLEMFALPAGLKLTTRPDMPKLHYFAATIANGTRLYGTCLTFMDPVPRTDLEKLAEKLYQDGVLTTEPIADDDITAIVSPGPTTAATTAAAVVESKAPEEPEEPEEQPVLEARSPSPVTDFEDDDTDGDEFFDAEAPEPTTPTATTPEETTPEETTAVAVAVASDADTDAVQLVLESPAEAAAWKAQAHKLLDVLQGKTVYASKCVCILSQHAFLQQYRVVLTEVYRITLTPETLPIERTISNLMLEVPLPPRGRIKVKYNIGDKQVEFKRPPPNNPLEFSHFRLRLLFECLDVKNVETIINALLTESRILILSTQLSALTIVTESLTNLLYPFQWHHVYIPLLPMSLIDFVQAPYPYLIGTHPSALINTDISQDVLDEILIVDLDNNTVKGPAPPERMPARERKKLTKALQPMEMLYRSKSSYEQRLMDNLDLAFFNAPIPDDVETNENKVTDEEAEGQERDLRESFFRVFVSLFKDYRQFMKTPTKQQIQDGDFDFFKTNAFIKAGPSSSQSFLRFFTGTQAFQHFVQDRVFLEPDDSNIMFFDESVISKRNRNTFTWSKPTPFLDRADYGFVDSYNVPTRDATGVTADFKGAYDSFPKLDPKYLSDKPRDETPLATFRNKKSHTAPRNVRQQSRRFSLGSSVTSDQVIFTVWYSIFTALTIENGSDEDIVKALDMLNIMEAQKVHPEEELFRLIMNAVEVRGTPALALQTMNTMRKFGYAVDDRMINISSRVMSLPDRESIEKLLDPVDGVSAALNNMVLGNEESKEKIEEREQKYIALFEFTYPGLTVHINETCPACVCHMSDHLIRMGWTTESNSYTTSCPSVECGETFVARFRVAPVARMGSPTNRDASVKGELFCEYLSPWVLRKEIKNILANKKATYLLSTQFKKNSAALYWNLAWHLTNYQLPTKFFRKTITKPKKKGFFS